jgi:quinol-cytochrome oxidoreductase complex cytochrome b subunit
LPSIEKNAKVRSPLFRPVFKVVYWFFVLSFIGLGWLGGKPIEEPYTVISRVCAIYYFGYFIIIIPVLNKFEIWAISKRKSHVII